MTALIQITYGGPEKTEAKIYRRAMDAALFLEGFGPRENRRNSIPFTLDFFFTANSIPQVFSPEVSEDLVARAVDSLPIFSSQHTYVSNGEELAKDRRNHAKALKEWRRNTANLIRTITANELA